MGFARKLLENVNNRFPDCGTMVEERCVANLLDPTLKGVHLVAANKFQSTKELVKTRWSHLEEMRVGQDGQGQEQEVQEVVGGRPLSPTSKLLKENGAMGVDESIAGRKLSAELVCFEGLPRLSKAGDPLLWWKEHENSLPMLASIVKEILAIPASSSKSERVFSIGTKVILLGPIWRRVWLH